MWTESQKWRDMRANGGHGVVRFDVFCSHCNKQIGEDVDADGTNKCGVPSRWPMDVFCNSQCIWDYEAAKNIRLIF